VDPDELRVKGYFASKGLRAKRFSKAETRAGKTPDFRVFQNDTLLFYCEVKSSPEDRWLDKQFEGVPPGTLVGGARPDPIFNRLTKDIHAAVKQFEAVNGDQQHPNVLALVNHDDMCNVHDLIGVLTGNFYGESGTASPIYKQYSEGRIQGDRSKIHLFIWLDDQKPEGLLFGQSHDAHHETLCKAFGVDPRGIRQIGS
jgi:hypothetical protein